MVEGPGGSMGSYPRFGFWFPVPGFLKFQIIYLVSFLENHVAILGFRKIQISLNINNCFQVEFSKFPNFPIEHHAEQNNSCYLFSPSSISFTNKVEIQAKPKSRHAFPMGLNPQLSMSMPKHRANEIWPSAFFEDLTEKSPAQSSIGHTGCNPQRSIRISPENPPRILQPVRRNSITVTSHLDISE